MPNTTVTSAIAPRLLEAYRNAEYRAGPAGAGVLLRVDAYSPSLAQYLVRTAGAGRHNCAAFISACNPRSELRPAAENAAAHARLLVRLRRLGIDVLEGHGADPAGTWREPSVLAVGLGLDAAREVGREFGQNAIIWAGSDAVARLELLR